MTSRARGATPAMPELLDRLRARGYEVVQSDEIEVYLDLRGAHAATWLQRDLLLRKDPRHIEVIEEFLHNVQHRIGLTEQMSVRELEQHVKTFMIRHHRLLGISVEDVDWLRASLEKYE